MIYFKDARVTVWKVEDKGKYSLVSLSSSRKNKEKTEYINSNWSFVRFVGNAYEKSLELKEKDRILINGGFSKESYIDNDGEKKWPKSPQMVVFAFEFPEYDTNKDFDKPPVVEEEINSEDDDSLPF